MNRAAVRLAPAIKVASLILASIFFIIMKTDAKNVLKFGDHPPCHAALVGCATAQYGCGRGDTACRYDPCDGARYRQHSHPSDQARHGDHAETQGSIPSKYGHLRH